MYHYMYGSGSVSYATTYEGERDVLDFNTLPQTWIFVSLPSSEHLIYFQEMK